MAVERIQRRLAAILSADVVGYSRLMGDDEEGTLARLTALREELLHPKIREYGGRIVKTTGDGTLIEFPSAVDAVNHAIDVQRSMNRRNADNGPDAPIELRIGINVGDVIVDGDDIFGDGVNVAARIESVADPGGISVSGTVYDQVRGKLHVSFKDRGEQSLKNIAEPVRIYAIELDDGAAGSKEVSASDAIFRRPAVAVLPFDNLSSDPEQEYFVDGLTEDIITALSLWKSFPVIARNSTFSYKGRVPEIRKVGEELGARYVLEGSVRRANTRVRITAQLINSETGHHVWADRYDRELSDVFGLQDEITHQIVATLVPELERAEHEKSVTKAPSSLDAWDCYLQGVFHLNSLGADAVPRAREMLERAIGLDPNYAKAHAKLAHSYHRELWLNLCRDTRLAADKMLDHARSAVRLDDSDSSSHTYHALALVWHGHLETAIQEASRAKALNPIDVDANFSIGTVLAWDGRPEEGIPHMENAIRISPHDPRSAMFYSQLAAAHFDAEDFETAVVWAQKALTISSGAPPNANSSIASLVRLASLIHLGQPTGQKADVERIEPIASGLERTAGIFSLRIKANTKERILENLRRAALLD